MNDIIKENLNLLDWDFKQVSTKDSYPHNICWYPSRYIPQIPAMLINELSNEGDSVLDPFGGSGTTQIEAARLNRKSVGIDLNPLAKFMSDTKLGLLKNIPIKDTEILSIIDEIEYGSVNKECKFPLPPDDISDANLSELMSWYHPETFRELLQIRQVIDSADIRIRDILKLVFLSIAMPTSGLDTKKPYTYYADKVKPSTDPIRKDALSFYSSRLTRLVNGIKKTPNPISDFQSSSVLGDISTLDMSAFGKFDLIVTSPPYLNVTDYNNGFRLAHLWYDFGVSLDELKKREIGARYKRKRKNAYSEYMSSMELIFDKCSRVLKDGGYFCVIIGESVKYQNKIIPPLIEYLEAKLRLSSEASNKRNVNQNYFLHPKGGVKKEEILVFRK